ncbi:glycosyltransferase [Thermochromatium tepidum]|uniref:Glycosyltransferase n=1 Tax=Thermochromatium tepidum ATCC 43061 TaxID=316276 RepID=A0A6I6ED05_THETI|nr:glycosyltransferase [Thermochromatium tepidum]QGU32829.1 glycosyltransferase [Thermochromatium tepidum ATCC 43061]
MSEPTTLQMVASKELGGAERWFMRFSLALAERRAPAQLAIRRGSALDGLELGGLPVHRLPYRTTWDPWSRRAVGRLIQDLKPEVVQTYMGRATRLTRLSRPGGPVHLARLGGYYDLGPYRHAQGWIGNTKALCDWMVRQGLPAARVYHIYNFADPAHPVAPERIAACRALHGLLDDAWVLVTLGRLVPVKGQRYLIEALARLPETLAGRPLRLVMVGDGPLAPRLRLQAEQSGQSHRIVWAGWQADPAPYLQMADLVVFPSLEEETLGNVILEAWAWGKPLVTASFRGARELTRHGEDAWCVPCADAAALAEGIRQTLSDPALMAALVARGRERVEHEFGRRTILERYLELYRQVAGG